MSRFIQLHLLTSYPPANLNRDDLGRPKTAMMGGEPRLRVSSQSLKRAWRTSETFVGSVSGGEVYQDVVLNDKPLEKNMGVRSKQYALEWIVKELTKGGVSDEDSAMWSKDITRALGAVDSEKNELSQVVLLSDVEMLGCRNILLSLIKFLSKELTEDSDLFQKIVELQGKRVKQKKTEDVKKTDKAIGDLFRTKILCIGSASADMALFGRMMASSPSYNVEAAAQVAHAISVHSVVVEDDFFTAVDDLNNGEDDSGAAHLGETEFAAGLFYLYICIDKQQLVKNLSGDEGLANKTIAALIESAATVAPNGKQNSFASRARASYILCETGDQQPRSLSVAYLKPVRSGDMLTSSIKQLTTARDKMDKAYGACSDKHCEMNVEAGEGSLQAIIQCATEA